MDPTKPLKKIETCVLLRHKMMYVDEQQMTPGLVDTQSDTRIYWCNETMDALGPDGEAAYPEGCNGGRECFCPYKPVPGGAADVTNIRWC